MGFEVQIIHFMEFVQLVVSGPSSIGNFVELVKTVETESQTWGDTRVLVDLRSVSGRLSDDEQVFLGEMVALHMGHLDRVASVVPADQITRNSETAAQGLGVQLRVFASQVEALSWLVGRPLPIGPDVQDASGTPAQAATPQDHSGSSPAA